MFHPLLQAGIGGQKKEPVWSSAWSATINSDNGSGTAGYSYRQIINASSLTKSGSKVKLTFKASSQEGYKVDNVSIVERSGSTPDGTTTPAEVLFSGASGFTISSASGEITSDELTFSIDHAKDYLVIWDISGDTTKDLNAYGIKSGASFYYKAASDSYNQQSVSGFSAGASDIVMCIESMEVYG